MFANFIQNKISVSSNFYKICFIAAQFFFCSISVFEFKLLTICENEEINKLAEDTLEINLQASIQKSDQPSGDIRRETDKAVDIIAAHPDVTPLEIKRKCIIWSFNCSTPVGLLHILDVTQGDQFRNTFRNIAYEMHYIYGYAFIIQGKCTFESVSMVARMINKCKYVHINHIYTNHFESVKRISYCKQYLFRIKEPLLLNCFNVTSDV
jgi:hypothetical protein